MEDSPSNAVLLEKLDSMSAVVLANQISNKEEHGKIIEQVTKTNGSVGRHDKVINMIVGGLIVSNAILIPSILILFAHYINGK